MNNSKSKLGLMVIILFASAFTQTISAQTILDALGKGKIKDKVQGVLENVAGNYVKFNIAGEWIYKGATVDLKSTNQLANIGSNVLENTIDGKINEQLNKIGIKPDMMRITFKSDSSFLVKTEAKEFTGHYSYNKDNQELILKTDRSVPIKINVEVLATNINFYFHADGLLTFIKKITNNIQSESIQGVSKLLSNYENMRIGFKFVAADGRNLQDIIGK